MGCRVVEVSCAVTRCRARSLGCVFCEVLWCCGGCATVVLLLPCGYRVRWVWGFTAARGPPPLQAVAFVEGRVHGLPRLLVLVLSPGYVWLGALCLVSFPQPGFVCRACSQVCGPDGVGP